MPDANPELTVHILGLQPYETVWQNMRDFTQTRDESIKDQLWLVEHPPVFTQGQAGKPEHILFNSDIPVIETDRGGQVTYHGPGQIVAYPLLNLKRLKLGVRELVTRIERSVVTFLQLYNIDAYPKKDAPGVYVNEQKIASLGLRVRKGCSYHGVAININPDLSPFLLINPCGYAGLSMTRLSDLTPHPVTVSNTQMQYARTLSSILNMTLCD